MPVIFAVLASFPPGSAPAGFDKSATVEVVDGFGARADASVTMNGLALAFSVTNQDYEGDVVVAPGDKVSVKVVLDGVTYTASGNQFASYPAISAPTPGARWAASIPNVIGWSGGGPPANAEYVVGILDKANPNASLIWPPSDTFDVEPIGATSVSVPAGSVSFGQRLAVVGVATPIGIPGADPQSALVIAGFGSPVPFVSDAIANSVTLVSVDIFPSNQVVGKGATQQFTANGLFSDGSHFDLTTQVDWTSSDPAKATINSAGSATGIAAGVLTVSAALGNVSKSVAVDIVPTFLPGAKYPNPFYPTPFNTQVGDTAVGDLNGDGRIDVAVIGSLGNQILIYYQNAQGTFDSPQDTPTDLTLKGIAIADVNNDGLQDVVVVGISTTATMGPLGRVAIFRQDGTTHNLVTPPDELTLSTDLPGAVAVADLNGDSLPDIVTAGTGSGANGVISMFFQGTGGALGPEVAYNNVPVALGATFGEMHVADMNNDGLNDIVVQSGALQLAVVKQLSPGTFSGTPDFYAVPSFAPFINSFALGDLNGDGRIDAATVDFDGKLNIFYQDVSGALTGPSTIPLSTATEVHIADFDGDGLNDLVLLNFGNNVRLLYQAADHSFYNPVFYNLPTDSTGGTFTHQAMSIGDVTGDGLADIVASWSTEGIFVLRRLP